MKSAELILRRRVAQLDSRLGDSTSELLYCIDLLSQITGSGVNAETAVISAGAADAAIADSKCMRELMAVAPEIVAGPLALDQQFWTTTGKPEHLPDQHPVPSELHFVTARQARNTLSTKPFGMGIFTATGVVGTDMWRMYLDLNKGSTLHPLPWKTWKMHLDPAARVHVREIASASDWVAFNQDYPRPGQDGHVYPDWVEVSNDFDAVHLTFRAIAAIQGLRLLSDAGLIAPAYWGLESTLWLRWRFDSAHIIHLQD